jgi:hypothetical protein
MEAADPPHNAGTKLNGIASHNTIILVITTMMTQTSPDFIVKQ